MNANCAQGLGRGHVCLSVVVILDPRFPGEQPGADGFLGPDLAVSLLAPPGLAGPPNCRELERIPFRANSLVGGQRRMPLWAPGTRWRPYNINSTFDLSSGKTTR